MTFLYSCRHDGDQYRISKLTHNLDVESSYLCTFEECECPAGVRPSCRHRQMLPMFIDRGAVSTGWMLDFDRGGWVDNRTDDELNESPKLSGLQEEQILMGFHNLPEGVQVFSLDDPLTLHNAIAEAVGEPEAKLEIASFTELPENINATEIAERFANLQGPKNPILEHLVDKAVDALSQVPADVPTPAKSFRRF